MSRSCRPGTSTSGTWVSEFISGMHLNFWVWILGWNLGPFCDEKKKKSKIAQRYLSDFEKRSQVPGPGSQVPGPSPKFRPKNLIACRAVLPTYDSRQLGACTLRPKQKPSGRIEIICVTNDDYEIYRLLWSGTIHDYSHNEGFFFGRGSGPKHLIVWSHIKKKDQNDLFWNFV